ncbi:unnamed protein product [Closterium sp. NIES-54]
MIRGGDASHGCCTSETPQHVQHNAGTGLKEEGIELPTIIVIGDQSTGKTSVLENLSGISLPRGKGSVAQVPLILQLQSCANGQDSIKIEYTPSSGKVSKVLPDKGMIEQEFSEAAVALAGNQKGVLNSPITLQVQRPGLPDLTLVNLPGITRVPVEDQPKDIYGQIKAMIMNYITPKESVILNVLAAEVDFSTCESIVMSQEVDPDGDRTFAVVTKVDRAPDGLYEKIQANSVRIKLGYVCVKNKTDTDASYEDARKAEAAFFDNHPELSRIGLSSRGVPALTKHLMEIQAKRVADKIPQIRKAIQKALVAKRHDVMSGVISGKNVIASEKQGHPPSNETVLYSARLREMFNKFEAQMRAALPDFLGADYTQRCKKVLTEMPEIPLPNMLDQAVARKLVQELVERIEAPCLQLVNDCFAFATAVQQVVVAHVSGIHPGLNDAAQLHSGLHALREAKDSANRFVRLLLRNEKKLVFTLNHSYMDTVSQIQAQIGNYKKAQPDIANGSSPPVPSVEDFASSTASLTNLISNDDQAARDLQINMFSYAKVMHKRLCDVIPMEIRVSLETALMDGTDVAVWRMEADQQRKARLEETNRLKAAS